MKESWKIISEALVKEGIIRKEYGVIGYGEVEQILPTGNIQFDASLFSPSELESIKYIAEKFKEMPASDIAAVSHQEPAWKDNIDGKRIIPFHYAFEMVTVLCHRSNSRYINNHIPALLISDTRYRDRN